MGCTLVVYIARGIMGLSLYLSLLGIILSEDENVQNSMGNALSFLPFQMLFCFVTVSLSV